MLLIKIHQNSCTFVWNLLRHCFCWFCRGLGRKILKICIATLYPTVSGLLGIYNLCEERKKWIVLNNTLKTVQYTDFTTLLMKTDIGQRSKSIPVLHILVLSIREGEKLIYYIIFFSHKIILLINNDWKLILKILIFILKINSW